MADLRPVYVVGDGDVKGPASASNNFLPLFADTTGKLLKSSGTGVTAQGLAILDDNTPAEQRNTIGLGLVDNTSDINKPVSTAQQTALNLKQDKLGYIPVQQGGGIGQTPTGENKVYIGWSASGLKATVDVTDQGSIIFDRNTAEESVVGVAKIATQALTNAGVDDTTIVTPKKIRGGFIFNFAVNGYIFLPAWMGGFGMQWGVSPKILSGTPLTQSLPLAFPVANLWCIAAGSDAITGQAYACNAAPLTTSTIRLAQTYGTTIAARYFAIGY